MASLVDEWKALGARHEIGEHGLFVIDAAAAGEEQVPVLVLHGFPTSGADWNHALPALTARRRAIIPDFLGFGLSDKPDKHYSLFEQADLVEELMAGLGITEVALVTHDMGDSIGGELLARALDGALGFAVERRVLTNGSIYIDLADLSTGQQLLRTLPDELLEDTLAPNAYVLAGSLRTTLAPDVRADVDDDLHAMAELVIREDGHRLLARLVRYIDERTEHEGRWTGAIESHPAPLNVIWGDADPVARFPMFERLQERCPGASFFRLEGVGHYPMVEVPERFNAALTTALG